MRSNQRWGKLTSIVTKTGIVTALTLFECAPGIAGDMITGYDLLQHQQSATTEAVVEYCHQSDPQSFQSVETAYSVYLSSLHDAVATWIAERPARKEEYERQIPTDSPEVRKSQAQLHELGGKMVDAVKHLDPKSYCPWLANKLRTSTPESILKLLHEYDARVQQKLQKTQ